MNNIFKINYASNHIIGKRFNRTGLSSVQFKTPKILIKTL